MRDLAILAVVFGTIPIIFLRPHIGILIWCWIAYMNPHRLGWGIAQHLPIAFVIALVTLMAWVISREPKKFPLHPITILLVILSIWISITTVFAVAPDAAFAKWDRSIKILFATFMTIVMIQSRERILALIWIIVASIGFYGVKGGIFTILGGGQNRVWGPSESFIADNNTLALALIMALPLMRFLQMQSELRWVRFGLGGVMALTAISIIGSHSRGAFVAGVALLSVLFIRSRQRLGIAMVGLAAIVFAVVVAPDQWVERMESIQNYEQDESAIGRFQAWEFAVDVAMMRPITGGGFVVNADRDLFFQLVPQAPVTRSFHSVYFEVLGEHGFFGLAVFLSLLTAGLFTAQRLRKVTSNNPDQRWAFDLASMCQASLVGYMVGGAFLNLAFYDLFYHILVLPMLAQIALAGTTQTTGFLASAAERRISGLEGDTTTQVISRGRRSTS